MPTHEPVSHHHDLVAGVFFDQDLTQADANQLIATADTLSYRQLVILAAYAADENPSNNWPGYRAAGMGASRPSSCAARSAEPAPAIYQSFLRLNSHDRIDLPNPDGVEPDFEAVLTPDERRIQ